MDRFVKLERHALGGFGFSVIGGVDTHLPPMVCAVVQNGAAHLSGKVFAGDVILEANGKLITHLPASEVIQTIKNSSDELDLRLREDTGARDRARPYLRSFTVADPKIPLYQTKLHRCVSAPLGPYKSRSNTDQLHRKTYRHKTQRVHVPPNMRRTQENSSDDIRVVGRRSVLGHDEGADGSYSPKLESTASYRFRTYFPIDGKPPKTFEHLPVVKHGEKPERKSYPEEEMGNSAISISTSVSTSSLPKSCPYCGGATLASSPGLHMDPSGQVCRSPTRVKCRKCGKNLQMSASGSSLPEKPYSSHQTFESVHIKPSSSLPPNAALGTQPQGKPTENRTKITQNRSTELRTGSESVLSHTCRRGDEGYSGSSSEASVSADKPKQIVQESPRALAQRLFNLDGFSKDQVAPELSKNTTFGKTVAVEYLKMFHFSGLTIVESLRVFIKRFLLTGETQERERILIPFSNRYYQCNKPDYGSADAVHTLVCAILLLNTDHHGENIGKKMTLGQFLENMAGLCDGSDFPRDLLKSIYQEIRSSPLEWSGPKPVDAPATPKTARNVNGIRASPGNPYLEIQIDQNDKEFRGGLLYRKVTMECEGKKTSAWKRKWVPFYGTLKGLILFLHKPDEVNSFDNTRNCIGIHHSLASRATDYKKRPYVFRFVTADWREFLFQAKNRTDMTGWIDTINEVAATFSAPPLPPPIGSCKRFLRPVLPFSKTRLTLPKQLEHHEKKAKEAEQDLIFCLQNQPREGTSRELQEWQEKHDYLEYEYKRYMAYVSALRGSKLESKMRDKPKGDARACASCDW